MCMLPNVRNEVISTAFTQLNAFWKVNSTLFTEIPMEIYFNLRSRMIVSKEVTTPIKPIIVPPRLTL